MRRAYSAESLIDAQLVSDWLEGHGVPNRIFHQNAIGAMGELPVTPPEVWITRDTDFDKATIAIQAMTRSQDSTPLVCGNCTETSPAGFDICWQCQSMLPTG